MMRLRVAVLAGLTALVALSACHAPGKGAAYSATAAVPAGARERATIRLQLATGYLEAGQPAIALTEAEQAVAADPDFADAYHVRALAQLTMGWRDLAEKSFAAALSRNGADAELLGNYGWFLCEQDRYAEAMPLLRRAVALPDQSGSAAPVTSLAGLGACQLRQGDLTGARDSFGRALAADPANPLATLGIGELYYRQGDLARAAQAAARLNAGSGASARSLWLAARIAHRRNDAAAQDALIARLRQSFPASRELAAYEQGAWDE